MEVSFDIDANGILHVKAKDKGTGKEQSIRIEGSSGLSKDEKERMVKEAAEHATEDTKKKEEIDAKNAAETLVYTTEKMLHDNKDKVPEADAKDLEGKVMELKNALKDGSLDEIKAKADVLATAAQKVGAAMYQSQQSPSGEQKAEEVKPEDEAK